MWHVDWGSVVDNDGVFIEVGGCFACRSKAAPLLNCFGGTANNTIVEAIVAKTITGTDMAALRIYEA